jgi:hypothetical protein
MNMHALGNLCARHASGLKRIGLGAGAILLLSATSCTVNTSSDVVVPLAGRLIVDWTIEGSTDPGLCSATGSASFDIIVDGPTSGEFQAPCSSFATTLSSLVQGSYSANAVLVGPSGEERTTQIELAPFVMTSADLSIPLDFPASSFH